MESVGERLLSDVSVFVERLNRLEQENLELKNSRFNATKFYAVGVDVATVARMHDVSPYLVREYMRMGFIPQHPKSTQGKILIRMSDALMLDFVNLKEEAKMYRRTK